MKKLPVFLKPMLIAVTFVSLISASHASTDTVNASAIASHASTDTVNASAIASQCYSEKWPKQTLLTLAKDNFEIENDLERSNLAMQLLNCLAVSESDIRDGVAFTGLSSWLRNSKLPANVYEKMFNELFNNFAQKTVDEHDVYQPFVALVLSELARVDRKTPYLTDEQRQFLVDRSAAYLVNTKDYRGFDNVVGWRHSIAHTADLFLQLSLNPAIKKEQLTSMLNAIGEQVLAKNEHFYIYGESKRLLVPLLYIFLQEQHSEEDWQRWLKQYINPAPLSNWQQAFSSQQGLAKLHNARQFLNAMFVMIADSKNAQLQMLKAELTNTLKTLP